jgi:arylsulfatase A-like enzyme
MKLAPINILALAFGLGAFSGFAQESLPFPETPSSSTAGRSMQESVHHWRQTPNRLPKDAPNIIIFLVDDAGYGNYDTFGGPIHTPTLSRIYDSGIAYNRFHTCAMCSPTRASLLTGRNHHRVGNGQISEFANDWDGYTGIIPRTSATIARVLSEYGYTTWAFGKWHNTPPSEVTKLGPFDNWPTGLGFDYFYGFMAGETSQCEPRLFENNIPAEPPYHDPSYHLTVDLAKKAIAQMRLNRALSPERPFFMYFAPGAVHGPHQVQKEWADKYKGKFDQGWEKLREETFARQKELGWIPANAKLTPRPDIVDSWESIPQNQRAFQSRLMEIYAGFLEHTDAQFGKIVDELEAEGIRDNTMILYLCSDNGASGEGVNGTISELLAQNGMVTTIDQQIKVLDQDYGGLAALGGPEVDNMYHHGWAWAGDTPLKYTKLIASHFGGTRTPLAISWPKEIKPEKTPRPQFTHVNDIAPTIYEILNITPPRTVDGVPQDSLDGISMVYSFADAKAADRKHTQYFEIMGSRGIYHDGWMASAFGPKVPWRPDLSKLISWTPDQDVWELYYIEDDFSQADDLAAKEPAKLAAMKELFTIEAANNHVFPVGGGLYTVLDPLQIRVSPLTQWTFYEGQNRIGETLAPSFKNRSTLATVDAEIPQGASGVIFAVGGISAGFTVFLDNGELHLEYNAMTMNRYKVKSDGPIATGKVKIEIETVMDDPQKRGTSATVTLRVNGQRVGGGKIGNTVPALFTASETFDVGEDLGSPVSLDYVERAPFKFTGKIEKVTVKYIGAPSPNPESADRSID